MHPELQNLRDEIRTSLMRDLIDPWFPRCVRSEGGFHQEFEEDWTPVGAGGRGAVFQSRMTWVCARMAESGDERFIEWTRHGMRFLIDRMQDPTSGAIRWALDAQGRPAGPYAREIHAYGISFAIYALAAAARALKSEEAIEAASRAFGYLERCHYDAAHRGWFEATTAEGKPILGHDETFFGRSGDGIGTRYGRKSQNTHLHLVEAFTDLYRVWPDPLLRQRLEEAVSFFLNDLHVEPGWLHVFVERDWTPIEGDLSYGHDVEATHLVQSALDVLAGGEAPFHPRARSWTDYALEHGWDNHGGGFLYMGHPQTGPTDRTKEWWVQAEGLLALATMWKRTGEERYIEPLVAQWRWIRERQIDAVHGGWWASLTLEGKVKGRRMKGHAWKAAYHDGRALMDTARLLENEV